MSDEISDYCLGCTLYQREKNLKDIIKKWENEIEYIENSGMSESDDPYFAIENIRKFIKDLKEGITE